MEYLTLIVLMDWVAKWSSAHSSPFQTYLDGIIIQLFFILLSRFHLNEIAIPHYSVIFLWVVEFLSQGQ